MTLLDTLDMILAEHAAAVEKYGTWSDYTVDQMMSVIINELMCEAGGAEAVGDLHGEHGVVRELAQVAACCIKAIMVLAPGSKETLAETVRTEGAHSEVEGRALPASPSLHQGKESAANHPIEVTL